MKKLIFSLILLSVFNVAEAADDKTVTLITSGQGQTLDDAKQKALRNAIEQAFGAFISSHTELVNDNLIKDEIISVSNGNIQKYEVISETLLPDNMGYATTIKSIVSISKLTSFCESKGMKIEIQGALFAFNIIQKELSATNEAKVMNELVSIAEKIAPKMFDYSMASRDPISVQNKSQNNSANSYCLPIKVFITVNDNWENLSKLILKTLSYLALTNRELEDYKKLNLKYYPFDNYYNQKKFNGKYYFKENGYQSENMTEEQFDNLFWDNIIKGIHIDYRKFQLIPKGITIKDDKLIHVYSSNEVKNLYKLNNYEESNFYFRTDVGKNIQSICDIINQEAFSFNIQSTIEKNLSFQSFNFFFQPISIEGSDYKSRNTIDRFIYADRDGYQNLFFRSYKKTPYFFIKQIESNSIIGYAYCYSLLSLDQIKTLTKLEIKHNY
jgi:hypothetical protein